MEKLPPPLLEKRDPLLHQLMSLTLHVTQRQCHLSISRAVNLSLYRSSLPGGQVIWRHRLNCLLETETYYNIVLRRLMLAETENTEIKNGRITLEEEERGRGDRAG